MKILSKLLSALIACLIMVLSLFPLYAFAETNEDYTLTYKIKEDGTAKITGYEGTPIHLVIPSEIDGYTVTSIESNAFKVNAEDLYYDANCYCPVETIVIEEGITWISSGAFTNCKNLSSVTLPESLEEIDYDAFLGCDNLTSITLPKNINFIDSDAIGYYYVSDFSPERWEYEWWGEPMEEFTIYGYTDTAAETYANENGFTFIALDDVITTTITDTSTEAQTTSLTTTSAISSLCGDVNLDGKIDLCDVILLEKYAVESVELDEQQQKNGDCNADGITDSNDSLCLMRFLIRIIDSLPESSLLQIS